MTAVVEAISERGRLAAVKCAREIAAADAVFDRLACLAAELLETPIALVCLVDVDRQVFVGAHGLPDPVATVRETVLEYSICQHVVGTGLPLIVGDTARHGYLADHRAVTGFGVTAYAGIPVIDADGYALGTMCVMDTVVRDWTDDQLAFLALLAAIITEELCPPLNPPSR